LPSPLLTVYIGPNVHWNAYPLYIGPNVHWDAYPLSPIPYISPNVHWNAYPLEEEAEMKRSMWMAMVAFTGSFAVAGVAGAAYDGFGLSFPIYANGGTGFSGPWAQGGFNVVSSGYAQSRSSLCYRQLRTGGGSVSGGAFSAINGVVRNLTDPLGADYTTVYVSFLLQPRKPLNGGLSNGFFGITLNGSLGNDLFIGKPGGGALEEYVLENRGGSGQVSSGAATVEEKTALLVVKVEFLPGNDLITLHVDPNPGHSEPSGGAVKSDLDLGVVSTLGIYSTGPFSVDEIRTGATYAEVLPVAGKEGAGGAPGCH
jgi:hypothetical protein